MILEYIQYDFDDVLQGSAPFKRSQDNSRKTFKTTCKFHMNQHPVDSVWRLSAIFQKQNLVGKT